MLLLTLVLFFSVWAVCSVLSYHFISFGLIPYANTSTAVGIWTMQNMLNSLVIIGFAGLVYSLIVDGAGILLISYVNPLSCPGLLTVCILAGLGRAIAAIHCAVIPWMSVAGDELTHLVLDICDVESPARGTGRRLDPAAR